VTKLWPHQERAARDALGSPHRGWLLDMKMGTGKTLTAISCVERSTKPSDVMAVVCPLAVVPTWPTQLEKHAEAEHRVLALGREVTTYAIRPGEPATQYRHKGIARVSDKARLIWSEVDAARARNVRLWVVLNYDSARVPDMVQALTKLHPAVAVYDESHKAKDPRGATFRAMDRIYKASKHTLALTGTPMPHSPMDIYAQSRLVAPGVFGQSYWQFRGRYAVMGGFKMKNVVSFRDLDDMRKKIDSFSTHVGSEVLKLDTPTDVELRIDLSPSARAIYDKLDKAMAVAVKGGTVTAANAPVKLMRLQQITGGWLRLDGDEILDTPGKLQRVDDGKEDALAELIDGLPPREPLVVFCRFRADIDSVHSACKRLGVESRELSGTRHELEEWKAGGGQVIAVQIQAGGAGVDLTRACYVAYYSLGYSLGDYLQSRARAHRPGQLRHVTYFHLVVNHSIDQKVYRALERRQDVIEAVLGEYAAQ